MTAALEDLLNSVLDCTVDAVLMTDDDGVIVYVNSSLMRLFGYIDDADSPVGMSIGVLLPDADEMDVEGRRLDGSLFAVDVDVRCAPRRSVRRSNRPRYDGTTASRCRQRHRQNRPGQRQAADRAVAAVARLCDPTAFALGTSILASASNETELTYRMDTLSKPSTTSSTKFSEIASRWARELIRHKGPWSLVIGTGMWSDGPDGSGSQKIHGVLVGRP